MKKCDEENRKKRLKKALKIVGSISSILVLTGLAVVRAYINGGNEELTETADDSGTEPAPTGTKYKFILHYPSGESDESDEVFDSYEEADAAGLYGIACCQEGAEIMEMSNPGDYPLFDYEDPDYEVIEVEE